MNKDKLSYFSIILFIIFIFINILIYIDIIPFIIWRISNITIMFIAFFIAFKRRNIKEKNIKLTILGFLLLFIWSFTEILILLKYIK